MGSSSLLCSLRSRDRPNIALLLKPGKLTACNALCEFRSHNGPDIRLASTLPSIAACRPSQMIGCTSIYVDSISRARVRPITPANMVSEHDCYTLPRPSQRQALRSSFLLALHSQAHCTLSAPTFRFLLRSIRLHSFVDGSLFHGHDHISSS